MEPSHEPPLDEVEEEELVRALMDQFKAQELREWMSANDLTRSRAADKQQSAEEAVEQARDEIARYLHGKGALDLEWERRCRYFEACGNSTPGKRTEVCDECVDLQRFHGDELDGGDFASMEDYMAALHERHA